MFWNASLWNIVPEQFVQWSHMTLKLDAYFVIKGVKASGERKAMT